MDDRTSRTAERRPQTPSRTWTRITVDVEGCAPGDDFTELRSGPAVIASIGTPLLVQDTTALDPPTRLARGDASIVSAAAAATTRWRGRAVIARLPPQALRQLARVHDVDLETTRRTRDVPVHMLLELLLLESEQAPDGGGTAYRVALETALAVHLVRRFGITRAPADAAIERALHFVDANLAQPLRLAHLARAAHLSPCHFARRFKAAMGVTPHEWLVQRRIERARQLLETGGAPPLARVAALVGFADQSHFTRQFRRRVGTTPRRFIGTATLGRCA